MSPRALACPASLKGVLSATAAAGALDGGLCRRRCRRRRVPDRRRRGGDARRALLRVRAGRSRRRLRSAPRCPRAGVRDDGTRRRGGGGGDPARPRATRRDGALPAAGSGCGSPRYRDGPLVVTVGGTATMDARRGAARGARRACPVRRASSATWRRRSTTRLGCSARRRARRRSRSRSSRPDSGRSSGLAPYAEMPGSGAAGGLGAALASLGAELVPGRRRRPRPARLRPSRPYDLVVTGEGTVDETTWEGKAPAAVARALRGRGRPLRRLRRAWSGQGLSPPETVPGRAQRRPGPGARRISSSSGRGWRRSSRLLACA